MDGIVIASDQTLEWTLPWWLGHYQNHNSHPVAFIDFGLSFGMKDWCKRHGTLIPLRIVDFAEDTDPETARKWEEQLGRHFWQSRHAWFKKPLACLKSPFDRTIWIDVDCEVRGSITPLFEYASSPVGFAMVKEETHPFTSYPIYNSGVIVFRKNHPLLQQWADACLTQSRSFRGDQEVFSHFIAEKRIVIEEIPSIYNWSRCNNDRPDTVIQHWHGHHGKYIIRTRLPIQ